MSRHLLIPLLAFAIVLAACAGQTPAAQPPATSPAASSTQPPVPTSAPTVAPATATTAGLTLKDDAGRSVTLTGVPQRIISLAPSTTEIAFALGAGSRVVAVDAFSDYPDAAKAVPKVTQGFNYNYEQIVTDKPDLVLAAGITSPDVVKKLEDLKLTVLVVGAPTQSFASVESDIQLVGQALDAGDQAKQVIAGMENKIADVKATVAKATTTPRVYWELDATDPAKPYAPGGGAFLDDLIKMAGGTNVTASAKQGYAQVNAEEIVKADPEVIILSDAAYGTTPDSVKKRPGWDGIAAVKNNRVLPIDDNLVSRPGPRIADGLLAAAKLIHPELFEASQVGGTSYTDPFAYCAAVGTVDAPDARYTGPAMPDSIVSGLQKAMGTSMPLELMAKGSFWRCMGGKVYGCNIGANLPCQSKADTSQTPTQDMKDFCTANPTSDFIPAVVTGHETIYEWKCTAGAPVAGKQVVQVDAQGYQSNIWYLINP